MALASILLDLFSFKPYRGKLGPEDQIAIEVANMLRAKSLEGKLNCVWTSIPHEVGFIQKGKQGFSGASIRYARSLAAGFIPGSTDYVFVWPDGGGWIELKSKTSSLSQTQKLFRDWCVAANVRHAVCRSCSEVEEKLFSWGVLRS